MRGLDAEERRRPVCRPRPNIRVTSSHQRNLRSDFKGYTKGCETAPSSPGRAPNWSHNPSFNLWIANLHAGKMRDIHIFPLRPRPRFEHTSTPTKWRLVTRMLGLGLFGRHRARSVINRAPAEI